MALNLPTGPIGTVNSSGGLSVPGISSTQAANPINFGYTAPAPAPSGGSSSSSSSGGQVKSASTSGGYQVGGWYPTGPNGASQQWTGSGWTTTPMGSSSGQSAPNNAFPNAQQMQAQVDAAYAPVMSDLQNQLSSVQANQQNFYNSYTSPYAALQPAVDQALTTGQNLNAQQVQSNQSQQANALAQAKALYNQAQMGASARLGGSTGIGTGVSSAADFANAYYASQLGQQQSGINEQYAQNAGQLQTQAQTIQQQHDSQIQQIQLQQANALNQAQQIYQQQVQAIQNDQTMADEDKANANLQALQNLQNNAQNIQNQAYALSAQLTATNQASLDQLRNNIAGYQQLAGTSTNLSPYTLSEVAGVGQPAAQAQQVNTGSIFFPTNNLQNPNQQQGQQQQATQQNI